MGVVTKLVDIGEMFAASGLTWYRPHRVAWNGDPIYIDQYSSSGTYNPAGPNAVQLVLQGHDRFGDVSDFIIPVTSYTTGMSVNGAEVSDKVAVLLSSPVQGLVNGGAVWLAPTVGSPGAFDIKFKSFSFQPSAIARDTGLPDTYNLGNEITLRSGIANYNSLDFDYFTAASGPILVIGYSTRAAGATTQDLFYQAFDEQGQAIGPNTQIASGMRAGGSFAITNNGTDFFVAKETISGGFASIEVRSFTPATGQLGTAKTVSTNFTTLFSISVSPQSDGNFDIVADGRTADNQHVINVYQADASFNTSSPSATITLVSANGIRANTQRMANDSLVLAYADAGQVHLAVFDAAGALIDNYVVPGITNFDRIRSLGQNQFELVWRENVAGNENAVKGAIYDVNTSARNVDQSGATTSVWQLGSHFDDNLKGGSAGDIFKGYAGNDTIDGGAGQDIVKFTGNKADYALVRNGDGSWTVTDTRGGSPDGVDTLRSVEIADFADGHKQLISAQATELTKLGPVFLDGADAPITGVVWGRPHRGVWNNDVVFIDSYSPTAGYVSGGPNVQTLVVAGQDKFGDLDEAVVVANYTSGKTVSGAEVLVNSVIMYKQAGAGSPAEGFALWLEPTAGGPPGAFDVKLQALRYAAGELAYETGNPSVTLVGGPTTLFAGVANYYTFDWNTASDGTIVVGYGTRALGAGTFDMWYTKVNPATGTPAYAPQKVDTTDGFVVMSVSGNQFTYISEDKSGGTAKLRFQNFDADTGVLGPTAGLVDPGNLADISQFLEIVQSDGSRFFVIEGTQAGSGTHVLQTLNVNAFNTAAGPTITTVLTAGQSLGRLQHQLLSNGLNVVGYTDNNQVHLSLFDQYGNLVSDTIVPGITNFDRLRNLGQNQVELIWRESDAGGGNVVKAAIFDGNEGGRVVNLSGSSTAQWLLGSHFADTMTAGSANDIFKGYAGNDTLDGGGGVNRAKFTGDRADYSVVQNGDGSWTVTDTRSGSPDGTDTLRNIQVLDFADQAVTLGLAAGADTGTAIAGAASGNVLTNDLGTSGAPLFVRMVNGSTAGVGAAIAGAYGTLILNADGSYSYTASGAPGAVGAHLHDTFTYVATDPALAGVVGADAASATATLDITLNRTAVVSASSYTPTHRSTTVAASALFSAADADGDAITKYQFWDDTAASTSGHWTLSGTAQETGKSIEVSTANLANMQWTVGSTADLVFVRVFDGFEWSAWKSFGINPAPENTPVVAAVDVSPAHGGTTIQASTLFSVADQDGDAITKYRLWDDNANPTSGHWTVNGAAQDAGGPIEIAASDLANTVWTLGATSDLVYVQAFDGVVWSSWKSFTIAAPENHAPVVAAVDVSPSHGAATIQASTLFSVTDQDGDAITKYRLWDDNANPTSGHWTVNGATRDPGGSIEIAASDLANTVWTLGATSDLVYVQAFDGLAWSSWKSFTIAAPENHAPVVAAVDVSPSHGAATIQASTLFSAADEDGDAITKYRLWDDNANPTSGHWTVNGATRDPGGSIEIAASDLANTVWTLGATSDLVYVQAFDGLAWSSWKSFTIAAPVNHAPVVAAVDVSPSHGAATVQASTLFSAADEDGDAITKYRLWDDNANPTSGHWTVNGATRDPGGSIEIAASDLANTVWSLGATSDLVYIQAFDGLAWSSWKSFTITAPENHAPVVVATDHATAHGATTIPASTLFSATDPDGDAITKYRLWDDNANPTSGHWTVNGAVQDAGGSIEIAASDLANTVWSSGATSDLVYIQAFDGNLWSSWKSFTITAPENHAPVVVAADYSLLHGTTTTPATMLFSATDPDGDAITTYRLWDDNASSSSGYWTVNGVARDAGGSIEIAASDLANTVWTSGSTSDLIYVQASDGLAWSAWASFTIAAPPNEPPVVSAADQSATHGQILAASTLFSVTDPDGDAITKYQLWDDNANALSGHWAVNGVARDAGGTIEIGASDLANTAFHSGSGSDLLYARAFDGLIWGNWKAFTVSAPEYIAPVVSASDASLTFNQTVGASSLFSVTDADGDAITKYEFWDSNPATSSGHWSVNGEEQQAQRSIEVLAADLASANFTAGSADAVDQLYVRAFDGHLWSDWKSFNATSQA